MYTYVCARIKVFHIIHQTYIIETVFPSLPLQLAIKLTPMGRALTVFVLQLITDITNVHNIFHSTLFY